MIIRPTRNVFGELIIYERLPIESVSEELACWLEEMNFLTDKASSCVLEIIDEDEVIVHEYLLTVEGFEYIVETFNIQPDLTAPEDFDY